MGETIDDGGCRHCSGLCAGAAARCPYCKKWLRREPAELSHARAGSPTGELHRAVLDDAVRPLS